MKISRAGRTSFLTEGGPTHPPKGYWSRLYENWQTPLMRSGNRPGCLLSRAKRDLIRPNIASTVYGRLVEVLGIYRPCPVIFRGRYPFPFSTSHTILHTPLSTNFCQPDRSLTPKYNPLNDVTFAQRCSQKGFCLSWTEIVGNLPPTRGTHATYR